MPSQRLLNRACISLLLMFLLPMLYGVVGSLLNPPPGAPGDGAGGRAGPGGSQAAASSAPRVVVADSRTRGKPTAAPPPKPTYPMPDPGKYPSGTPERAASEFLSAWQEGDFERMADFASPDWRGAIDDPGKRLGASLGGQRLLGAELGPPAGNGDLPMKLWLESATGDAIRKEISGKLAREPAEAGKAPGAAGGQGSWGLDPAALERALAGARGTPEPPAPSEGVAGARAARPGADPAGATAAATGAPSAGPSPTAVVAGPAGGARSTPVGLVPSSGQPGTPRSVAATPSAPVTPVRGDGPTAEAKGNVVGLGAPQTAWEQAQSEEALKRLTGEGPARSWNVVTYADGSVSRVERIWSDKVDVPLDVARAEARTLLPPDAKPVRSANGADVFASQTLKDRFPSAAPWRGGEPGQATVTYKADGPRVRSMVVQTGP